MKQMREFAQNKPAFDAAGVNIVAISSDNLEDTRKAWVIGADRKFTLLSDPDLKVIREYGLVHAGGFRGKDIAIRTTLFVDENGKERFRIVSETVPEIPEAQEVLNRIAALK